MAEKQNIKLFLDSIETFLPKKRIYTDELRTLAWGTDAGFYRLIPQAVVMAETEEEVQRILKAAWLYDVPVTFRAAGTSLSGQSITDSVLLVAAQGWDSCTVSDDAATVTVGPGMRGGRLNEILKPYGVMFAPDPASKAAAMVGGIISNNASGMNCGTHANSDRIIKSARLIFADGTLLDTGDPESRKAFSKSHPQIIEEIEAIRDTIKADPDMVRRIRYKYSIKNVTGLNLLPFLLFDDPFEIITHCIVGSEGTLAFIARATLATSHLHKYSASAMAYFKDIATASRSVVALKTSSPVFSCEMLDAKSLASVNDPTGEGLTALLIETKADTEEELRDNIDRIMKVLGQYDLAATPRFTVDPEETARMWAVRSGIFPAVGATREPGTTVIIEDVAFHISDLPSATRDLQALLEECGYPDACIYGHALEGNYHFIIAQRFDTPEEVARYRNLMEKIEQLVVGRYDGSLKAEHGVGRNMSQFVSNEWGVVAWTYMRRIKDAFDPSDILNRGSMFSTDPEGYLKNFKPLPVASPIIDKCIECGFCEPNCTSCGFSLSARQRTVIIRELARLKRDGSPEAMARHDRILKEFRYLGNATCAGDGLCSTSCPMNINTGEMIHEFRRRLHPEGSAAHKVGRAAANSLAGVSSGLRLALGAAGMVHNVLGDKAVNSIGRAMHAAGLPLWTAALPRPYHPAKTVRDARKAAASPLKVVYFPSCINRTMGVTPEPGRHVAPLVDTMVSLCRKAGYEVVFPAGMKGLCCGLTWESKGMPDIADDMCDKLEKALLKASENGRYPVLCDQSPCLHRMREHMKGLKLYEPVGFIEEFLVDRLDFHPTDEPVAVHVTCSSRQMRLGDAMVRLASRCSTNVTVPAEVGCCGFAGDKGFNVPELNRWALRKLRPALEKAGVKRGFSNSRTCEIGLTHNSGVSYKSIAYLVDECTTPRKTTDKQ